MSFILDALRKSESERQQDAHPSIARIPNAMPRYGVPAWAIATMGALALGVVVLAGAWVMTLTESPPTTGQISRGDEAAARGDGAERSAPVGTGATRDASRPEVAAYGTAPAPRGGADQRRVESLPLPPARPAGETSPLAQVAQPPPLAMAARTQASARDGTAPDASALDATPRHATPPPAAASTARETLPTVDGVPEPYHSVAAALDLPPLTLELLAYVDEPAERFVFINGARYTAGDRLPDGARVIAINSRGAVLLVNGRQLQLEPR